LTACAGGLGLLNPPACTARGPPDPDPAIARRSLKPPPHPTPLPQAPVTPPPKPCPPCPASSGAAGGGTGGGSGCPVRDIPFVEFPQGTDPKNPWLQLACGSEAGDEASNVPNEVGGPREELFAGKEEG
jgi:hypothetical protein